jgi:hypothetical protein
MDPRPLDQSYPSPGPPGPVVPPAVLRWETAYCLALGAVYLLLALLGLGMAIFRERFVDASNTPGEVLVVGLVVFLVGGVFAVPFLGAPFLPPRRWVWVLHLVLIAVGMTSCACIPVSVPLLVFWIRPETQAWFAPRGR